MSVNAPESGTIKELLVNEEDTVTVGQEIIKLEPGSGGASKSAETAESEPKEPKEPSPATPEKQDTTKAESKGEDASPKKESPPPTETVSQKQPEKHAQKPKETQQTQSQSSGSALFGSREERRVRWLHV